MASKGILERLSEGVVLGDGGYIIELEQRGYVVTGAFTPELAITHPDAIRELHREMRNAGYEVLQVMAFYGSRENLNTVGYGDRVLEINRAATDIAREVAGDDMLVAGDLSTTWMWEPDDDKSERLVADMFDEADRRAGGRGLRSRGALLQAGRGLVVRGQDQAQDLSARHDHDVLPREQRLGGRLHRGGVRPETPRCGRGHRGPELHERPSAHAAPYPRDARRVRRLPGGPAGSLPLHRRDPLVLRQSGLSRSPGAEPAHPVRARGVRVDREGPRRQLHRRLLRLQGDAHARDGGTRAWPCQ